MLRVFKSALFLAALARIVGADSTTTCGNGQQCPPDLPCCSQYGECGVGAFCLGGCDPVNSHSLDSCVPAPVCQNLNDKFTSLDGVVSNTQYLGDASKANWVSSGTPLQYQNSLLLTMSQGTVGTLLASTHYVWYGKITGTLKTSGGAGVVTAFILLADSKDEIDFEFVGVELNTAQTNFYSQGVPNYNNAQNQTGLTNVNTNWHTYEIDWTPDSITWSIDGNSVRVLQRSDTWNSTANRFDYPQTPARVQLSLWPGGLSTNSEYTIEWAGGPIQWNSPYMSSGHYYYAQFQEVDIQCYSPPGGANVQGSKSYIYTNAALTNNTVEVTNQNTVLQSLLGTGTNMTANYPSSAANASSSNIATIPGLSGAGPGTNGQRPSGTTESGSASTGFVQGGGGSNSAPPLQDTALQGSFFAVLVAIAGLLML